MSKQMWWAGLALAFAVAVSGCTEVKSCKEGENGCIGATGCSAGSCKFDLECVVRASDDKKVCAKAVGEGMYDFGGEGGPSKGKPVGEKPEDGGMQDSSMQTGNDGGVDAGPACECPGTATCTSDTGECFDFCAQPEGPLPGSLPKPEAIWCVKRKDTDPDLTFNQVCKAHCKLQCQRWEWFCDHECDPSYCGATDTDPVSAEALAACTAAAGAGAADVQLTSLQGACMELRAASCPQTKCPNNMPAPNCESYVCDNVDCGNSQGTWNFDGWCDDGDTFNTHIGDGSMDSDACRWGTDCADCGPRKASDPEPENLAQGELCNWSTSCAGYKQTVVGGKLVTDLETNKAWCFSLDKVVVGLARCVPDCSGKDEKCPSGYACTEFGDAVSGLTPAACLPMFCD